MGNTKFTGRSDAIRSYVEQECSSDTLIPKQAESAEVELFLKSLDAFQTEYPQYATHTRLNALKERCKIRLTDPKAVSVAISTLQLDETAKPAKSHELSLLDLPRDILQMLFSKKHMDPASLVAGRSVCRQLRSIVPLVRSAIGRAFCFRAADIGSLGLLQWARANGACWNGALTCEQAAYRGHLKVLQWARANGAPWNVMACASAAEAGHLAVLQWARANGAPWDEQTCMRAASGGQLQVLQWALANGAQSDARTCAFAARRGQLGILKWLRANGAPWDANTCATAAEGGHLDVLQWARANNAPWDVMTCAYAVSQGHLDVLRWAIENGCPGGVQYVHYLNQQGYCNLQIQGRCQAPI